MGSTSSPAGNAWPILVMFAFAVVLVGVALLRLVPNRDREVGRNCRFWQGVLLLCLFGGAVVGAYYAEPYLAQAYNWLAEDAGREVHASILLATLGAYVFGMRNLSGR